MKQFEYLCVYKNIPWLFAIIIHKVLTETFKVTLLIKEIYTDQHTNTHHETQMDSWDYKCHAGGKVNWQWTSLLIVNYCYN